MRVGCEFSFPVDFWGDLSDMTMLGGDCLVVSGVVVSTMGEKFREGLSLPHTSTSVK